MLRYAFRLHRWGMVGFGLVVAIYTAGQGALFVQVAGNTPAGRAAFAHQMSLQAAQDAYLIPAPHSLDTLTGYLLWRAWGTLPVLVTLWAVAAAAGAARGDEQRLLVDGWIAARVSRRRIVASRIAAFGLAALVVTAAAGIGTLVVAAGTEAIGIGRVAGQVLALWLFLLTAFAIAYLAAQVPVSTRGAQGAGVLALVLLFVVDAADRTMHSLDGLAWISPYHWYNATYVLVPGGQLDLAGVLLSITTIGGAGSLAGLAFASRDVRSPLLRLPARARVARDAPPSALLSMRVARLLFRQRWLLLVWALAVSVLAVYMVGVARSEVDSMLAFPNVRALLTQGGADPYRSWIGIFWFRLAQLMLAGFALHVASGWAADDGEGVLAAELSRPRHRWGIVLERAIAMVLALSVLAGLGSLALTLASRAQSTSLELSIVLRATWLLVPFALTFAAAAAVGIARWPRATVGVLGVVAFLSFLDSELAAILKWPDWVANLSPFSLYGAPMISGVFWSGLWAMLAVVTAGFGLSVILMQRREVAA